MRLYGVGWREIEELPVDLFFVMKARIDEMSQP